MNFKKFKFLLNIWICYGKYEFWVSMYTNQFLYLYGSFFIQFSCKYVRLFAHLPNRLVCIPTTNQKYILTVTNILWFLWINQKKFQLTECHSECDDAGRFPDACWTHGEFVPEVRQHLKRMNGETLVLPLKVQFSFGVDHFPYIGF